MIEIFTCPRDVLLFIFQEDACITIIINNLIRLLGYSLTESGYLYASNLYSISMLFVCKFQRVSYPIFAPFVSLAPCLLYKQW